MDMHDKRHTYPLRYGMQLFTPAMHTQGAVTRVRAVTVPKKQKWVHMLLGMEGQIANKLGAV